MKKPPIYTIYLAIACFILTLFSSVLFFIFLPLQERELIFLFAVLMIVSLAGGIALLIPGLIRHKNRVLGVYGERKIIVEYMGNIIEVYNFSKALSSINCITLLINNYAQDQYDGMANSELRGVIQTADGEKAIYLKSNNFIGTLRLYCENVLLAKKIMFFG